MITVSCRSCTMLIVSGESFKCILCMDLKQIRQNEKGKVRLKLAEPLMSKGTNNEGKPQVYGVVGMAMERSPLQVPVLHCGRWLILDQCEVHSRVDHCERDVR